MVTVPVWIARSPARYPILVGTSTGLWSDGKQNSRLLISYRWRRTAGGWDVDLGATPTTGPCWGQELSDTGGPATRRASEQRNRGAGLGEPRSESFFAEAGHKRSPAALPGADVPAYRPNSVKSTRIRLPCRFVACSVDDTPDVLTWDVVGSLRPSPQGLMQKFGAQFSKHVGSLSWQT